MTGSDHRADLAAVLAWYRDMGVDAAVGEEPTDWLSRGDADAIELRSGLSSAPPRAAVDAPHDTIPRRAPIERPAPPAVDTRRPVTAPVRAPSQGPARETARSARTLDELGAALASFDGCGLKATAKNLCFYRGAQRARLLIIGEAPGRDEDLEGKPFVGRAGQLLDKMLAAIGLTEADVHITNVVYWRPPGNRTPAPQETEACRPFLERQIELVGPEFIVLLGGAASQQILGLPEGIMKLRGSWREAVIGEKSYRVLPTLHPAYLLRTPAHKRLAWRDLLILKSALDA